MKPEYDFSKSRKNPYANQLKRQLAVDDSKQLASDEIEKRRPIIQAPKKEYKSR